MLTLEAVDVYIIIYIRLNCNDMTHVLLTIFIWSDERFRRNRILNLACTCVSRLLIGQLIPDVLINELYVQ